MRGTEDAHDGNDAAMRHLDSSCSGGSMRTSLHLLSIACLVSAVGCGGDSNSVTNPNPQQSAGTMSARIDGVAWTAVAVTVSVNTNGLIVSGASANGIGIAVGASRLLGTAPQPFGTGTNFNALATMTTGTQSWSATGIQGSNSSGSVTLTTLTATRAVGTFTFNAAALAGGATGTKVVTSGVFDVKF
jgi:hypothetical protein